jgi:hypothetical protein
MVRTRKEAGYGLNYGIFRGKKSQFGSDEQELFLFYLSYSSRFVLHAMYNNFKNSGSIANQPSLL